MEASRFRSMVERSEAMCHPYLGLIESGALAPDVMRGEVLARYLLSRAYFEPLLGAIIAKTSGLTDDRSTRLRGMIWRNWLEERGFGDEGKSHAQQWHRLLRALGFTEEAIVFAEQKCAENSVGRGVRNFARRMNGIVQKNPIEGALGCFTYAVEAFAGPEYGKWLEGTRKVFPTLGKADLTHFVSHSTHDPRHADEAEAVLAAYVPNQEAGSRVESCIQAALMARKEYFDNRLALVRGTLFS